VRRTAILAALLALSAPFPALADGLAVHGVLDLRLVSPGGEPNWMEGGLGKLRWGGADSAVQLGDAALVLEAPFAPAWFARATAQAQADDGSTLDLLDAWVRWRPVSTGRWRHALKAGLFFPPVSLEHEGVGWTSPYTLTPAAMDGWIGEEIRLTGVEWRIERRGAGGSVEAALTAFGGNDTAGELLAARGWALSDRAYGVGGTIREPDTAAFEAPPPRRFDPFTELDHRPGIVAELTVRRASGHRVTLLHYDNNADPSIETHHGPHEIYAWRTRFTSAAWERRGARNVWQAQAIEGDTEIRPSPFFRTRTDFWAAHALWARASGPWRPAARVEWFGTRQWPDFDPSASEHGHAATLALTWQPRPAWQLTGELVALRSVRGDRGLLGRDQAQSEAQVQLAWRWFF
jgi:hypothetical protein